MSEYKWDEHWENYDETIQPIKKYQYYKVRQRHYRNLLFYSLDGKNNFILINLTDNTLTTIKITDSVLTKLKVCNTDYSLNLNNMLFIDLRSKSKDVLQLTKGTLMQYYIKNITVDLHPLKKLLSHDIWLNLFKYEDDTVIVFRNLKTAKLSDLETMVNKNKTKCINGIVFNQNLIEEIKTMLEVKRPFE